MQGAEDCYLVSLTCSFCEGNECLSVIYGDRGEGGGGRYDECDLLVIKDIF